jgi:predicted Zn finger-like uncharacterized protein
VQAQCTQCATRIQIDDAKVPDKPFKVRCPRCQVVLSLPGRGGEATAAGPAAPQSAPSQAGASASASAAPARAPEPAAAGVPAAAPAVFPSAASLSRQERLESSQTDAIVALAGPAAPGIQQALTSLGFDVDAVSDIEEGARLLEQGVYEMAVTSPDVAEPGRPETLAQRIQRMPPDTRRRVFVVLVGEQFRSGDGTQAWAAQADLVINPADTARCETLVRATMAERRRLYQVFFDTRRRLDAE